MLVPVVELVQSRKKIVPFLRNFLSHSLYKNFPILFEGVEDTTTLDLGDISIEIVGCHSSLVVVAVVIVIDIGNCCGCDKSRRKKIDIHTHLHII